MRRASLAVVFLVSLATACGGDDDPPPAADAGYDCSQDDRGEVFTAGMSKSGAAGYGVSLVDALPSPPDKGDNAWTVAVTLPGGAAATDEVVVPRLCMPDHNHGTPTTPTVTANGDGTYSVGRLNFFMAGLWEIELLVRDADDTSELPARCQVVAEPQRLDAVVFRFCVDG